MLYGCYDIHILTITGKDNSLDESNGVTHAVVLKLVEGLENRGHHLYCDNYYSSPILFTSLWHLGFGACGTVRTDRKKMPQQIADAKLKKGEVISCEMQS